jgi:hypothetical protein
MHFYLIIIIKLKYKLFEINKNYFKFQKLKDMLE